MNKYLVITILALGLALIGLGVKKCVDLKGNKPKPAISIIDTLINNKQSNVNNWFSEREQLLKHIDSLESIKPKIKNRLIYVVDSSYKASPDTCREAIRLIYKQCLTLDSSNKVTIYNQYLIIKKDSTAFNDLNDIILLNSYKSQLKTDSINQLKADLKIAKRKAVIAKGIGWLKSGLASVLGFGLGKATP